MTRDERLEAALAKLSVALCSLEAAASRGRTLEPPRGVEEPGLGAALEHALAKIERLEAASDEASRVLKGAIEALGAVVRTPGTPGTEERHLPGEEGSGDL